MEKTIEWAWRERETTLFDAANPVEACLFGELEEPADWVGDDSPVSEALVPEPDPDPEGEAEAEEPVGASKANDELVTVPLFPLGAFHQTLPVVLSTCEFAILATEGKFHPFDFING